MTRQTFFLCMILLSALVCRAQPDIQADIISQLREEGLEDIKALQSQDTLYLSIEDRSHRGTFRGATAAIKAISKSHPYINAYEVLLTEEQIPQLIVHASKRGDIWNVSVDRQMETARKQLKAEKPQAVSTGRINVTIFPMISLVNNKLDHLYDYSIRIAPAVDMNLWNGGHLTLQPIFPILTNVEKTDSKRYIQIGCANISQQIVSSKHWCASVAFGFFHQERWGAHAQVGYHIMRNLDIYVSGGLTGLSNYDCEKGFGMSSPKRFNALARADYYEPHTKLQFELQGGRFLYGDYGARLDITRHFGEYAVGVYGILTGGEHNAGFHFAIPFGGKRQKRNGYVRLRLPEYYSLEYSMVSYFEYWRKRMGEQYVTRPDQNHAAHYWEPAYVQEYIERMLNGTFK